MRNCGVVWRMPQLPGSAHAQEELPVAERLGGRDDEVYSLARPDAVGAALLQLEVAGHVVQEYARPSDRCAGAEAAAQGLRDRHDVAVPVRDCEVGRHPTVEFMGAARE